MIACMVLCLCSTIGVFVPDGMKPGIELYNLWAVLPEDGSRDFSYWPMFALLLIAATLTIFTLFAYKNRKRQAKMCVGAIFLCVAWCIAFAIFGYILEPKDTKFYPAIIAALPVVAIILLFMARSRILADEKLVRAADRIR